MLKIYNTLTKEKEEFVALEEGKVRMYTCGPTVYNYAHIGNLRSYVFADILRKTLEYLGYEVEQVMNITDIGHLASDADDGDDKMTKGLLREGKELTLSNMRELANFYTERFKEDIAKLNIQPPTKLPYASDHIKENIELIEKLEMGGYTYKTSDGIYFNIDKMPDYGVLWSGDRSWEEDGARIDKNSQKKNPADFALWKFNDKIGFESPWGKGFPGWHIECSAMGIKYLGEQFDIHTGGIDHIPIHHTNEIAQSECATGKKPFVRYWVHHEFVDTGGEKMAKSADNFLRLQSVEDKNIDPIVYRFWLMMGSYRRKLNFSWDALLASKVALNRLYKLYQSFGEEIGKVDEKYRKDFAERISDDLDTPRVLSLLWLLVGDDQVSPADKKATILEFDKILGLGFDKIKPLEIPEEVKSLVDEREQARQDKDFDLADKLRDKIKNLGYEVKDTAEGQQVFKI